MHEFYSHVPALLWTFALAIVVYRHFQNKARLAEEAQMSRFRFSAPARPLNGRRIQRLGEDWSPEQSLDRKVEDDWTKSSKLQADWPQNHEPDDSFYDNSWLNDFTLRNQSSVFSGASAISHPTIITSEVIEPQVVSAVSTVEEPTSESVPVRPPSPPTPGPPATPVHTVVSPSTNGQGGKSNGGCAVCGSPTNKRCSRCKAVKYCSPKCQLQHWREGHKNDCHS